MGGHGGEWLTPQYDPNAGRRVSTIGQRPIADIERAAADYAVRRGPSRGVLQRGLAEIVTHAHIPAFGANVKFSGPPSDVFQRSSHGTS